MKVSSKNQVTSTDDRLGLCFLILAYDNPKTLQKTLNALSSHPGVDIVLHVDPKTRKKLLPLLDLSMVTHVIGDPVDISWGDFSIVQACVKLCRAGIEFSTAKHFTLLSDSTVPTKNLIEFRDLLAASGKDFIYSIDPKVATKQVQRRLPILKLYPFLSKIYSNRAKQDLFNRFNRYVFFKALLLVPKLPFFKTPSKNLEFYFGSMWWTLRASSLKKMLENTALIEKIIPNLQNAFAPDEIFFHTLYFNTLGAKESQYFEQMSQDWNAGNNELWTASEKIFNLQFIVWNPAKKYIPKTLDLDDLKAIVQSKTFFARKCLDDKSDALVDRLFENAGY